MAQSEKIWRTSQYLCVFQDDERHLGHAVKTDEWHAYDATRLNSQKNGIQYLGCFPDLETAKQAVEASVAPNHAEKALTAEHADSALGLLNPPFRGGNRGENP